MFQNHHSIWDPVYGYLRTNGMLIFRNLPDFRSKVTYIISNHSMYILWPNSKSVFKSTSLWSNSKMLVMPNYDVVFEVVQNLLWDVGPSLNSRINGNKLILTPQTKSTIHSMFEECKMPSRFGDQISRKKWHYLQFFLCQWIAV